MGCIAEVVEAAGLTPDADPVADIRTGMMGPENPNWSGGPETVTCAQCGAVQRAECGPDQGQEDVLQLRVLRGMDVLPIPRRASDRLRTDRSELRALWTRAMRR